MGDPLRDPSFEVTLDSDPDDHSPEPLTNHNHNDKRQVVDLEEKHSEAERVSYAPVKSSAASEKRAPSSVSINSCMTYETQTPHTVYVISVIWDRNNSWTISRRFSEFSSLHDTLSGKVAGLPELPAKKMLFNLDPNFVNERRYALDKYISQLVKVEPILAFPEVQSFLKLQEHGVFLSPLEATVPTCLLKFKDPQFGINAISLDEKEGVAVSISENANVVSRVDSFLMNIKMPWEEKSVAIPVGCVVIWKKNSKGIWSAVVIRNYDCQASCFAWDKESRLLFVGLQTGTIKQYRIHESYKKVDVLPDISVHTSRVTGVLYDGKKGRLISCSRDKTGAIHDISRRSTISVTKLDETQIMSMCSDVENQRVFFGTEGGRVLVYSYQRDTFRSLHSFDGHIGAVRALHYDSADQYVFSGGFDCAIMIWKIGASGEENAVSKKIGVLRGGPPSRIKSIVFCPQRRHVISGHQNGAIAFWNTRDGSVLNVVQPHVLDVVDLQWSVEKEMMISCSRDGFACAWTLLTDAGNEITLSAPVYEKKDIYAKLMLAD